MVAIWRVLMRMGIVGGNLYFWPQLFGFGDAVQSYFNRHILWAAPLLLGTLALGSIAVDAEIQNQKRAFRRRLGEHR